MSALINVSLEKEYAEATAKLEQYQHRGQRYENHIRYYTEGERKKRNHRLITRGGAVESIVPEGRGMCFAICLEFPQPDCFRQAGLPAMKYGGELFAFMESKFGSFSKMAC